MGTRTLTEQAERVPTDNVILTGLARALGYDPENSAYGPVFSLMFPIIMKDWEELEPDDFMSRYGTLALHSSLEVETTIEYVLSIARSKQQ